MIGIDVNLGELDAIAEFSCDFRKRGSQHFARTAPLGPKVHQDRQFRLHHFLLEGCVRDVYNLFAHCFFLRVD